jgi:transposase
MAKKNTTTRQSKSKARKMFSIGSNPNAAGIDIGANFSSPSHSRGSRGGKFQKVRLFTSDLHRLADWLTEDGIETVAIESTGV